MSKPRLHRCLQCGAARNPGKVFCAQCLRRFVARGMHRPHDMDDDRRPLCQHRGCFFPVVAGAGHARWCAVHAVSFERREPRLIEAAQARVPLTW